MRLRYPIKCDACNTSYCEPYGILRLCNSSVGPCAVGRRRPTDSCLIWRMRTQSPKDSSFQNGAVRRCGDGHMLQGNVPPMLERHAPAAASLISLAILARGILASCAPESGHTPPGADTIAIAKMSGGTCPAVAHDRRVDIDGGCISLIRPTHPCCSLRVWPPVRIAAEGTTSG